MGEQRIDWIANEGARVSQLVTHVKAQVLNGVARSLRDSQFTAESVTATRTSSDFQSESTSADVRQTEGTVTWTVPIQISIRVGGQTAT
jgi:hypothetical protein